MCEGYTDSHGRLARTLPQGPARFSLGFPNEKTSGPVLPPPEESEGRLAVRVALLLLEANLRPQLRFRKWHG
jgi:hypothetical protein